MHRKADLCGPRQGLLAHPLGAPVDVLEHPLVERLQAQDIVAAVLGGAEHRAVPRFSQRLRKLHQHLAGQRRAVGVQHAGAAMAPLEHGLDRRPQAGAEAPLPGRDQLDVGGKVLAEEWLRSRRPEGHVGGDRRPLGGAGDVLGDVLQEAGVQVGRLLRGEQGGQPRLGAPGRGGLGHHGDRAGSRPVGEHRASSHLARSDAGFRTRIGTRRSGGQDLPARSRGHDLAKRRAGHVHRGEAGLS